MFHTRTSDIELKLDVPRVRALSIGVSDPAAGDSPGGSADELKAKQKEEDAQFYEAYRELGRLQTYVWIVMPA